MIEETVPQTKSIHLDLLQRNRRLQMQVTVVKHFPQNIARRKNGPLPEVNYYNINNSPPTVPAHPVSKLVDNYITGLRMRRFNCTINNGNKTQCLCVNDIGDRCLTKKSTLPNYHVNGVHPGCVKCGKHNRIRSNMLNINSRNALRLSLNEGHCKPKNKPPVAVTEIHKIEPIKPKPHSDNYVEHLKSEIKNCITKCCHLQKDHEEYAQRLKQEITVSKAVMSDEARNKINQLKNEIYDYRRGCLRFCDNSRAISVASPVPVKQVDQPTVQEKSGLDRRLPSGEGTAAPSNLEEKLVEANHLIEKVRVTLKDMSTNQKTEKPKEDDAIEIVTNLLKNIDKKNKELMQKLPSLVHKEIEKDIEKVISQQKEETLRMKVEEEAQKKLEEEKKKIEQELRQSLEEAFAKQKEEEYRRQMEEALEKQKVELRLKMEEELKSQKQEIIEKKLAEEPMNEWIPSMDQDIILQQSISTSQSKLDTISEVTPSSADVETDSKLGDWSEHEFPAKSSINNAHSKHEKYPFSKREIEIPQAESHPSDQEIEAANTGSCTRLPFKSISQELDLRSEENEPLQKPKLCVQKLPPVNIRGGLVIQRTLNLTIKPTGSAVNRLINQSNVGYQEIKSDMPPDNDEPEPPPKCPEDCKDPEGQCKYRILANLLDMPINIQRTIGDLPPDLLTDEAMMLLKSYQIFDQGKTRSEASSASSLARLLKLKQHYATVAEASSAITGTSYSVNNRLPETGTSYGVNRQPETGPPEPQIKDVVRVPKNPFEIGFYKSKGTQCGGNDLDVSDAENFVEGYMKEWSSEMHHTSPGRSSAQLGQRRPTLEMAQIPSTVAEEEEEIAEETPVRDIVPVSSSASGGRRRVSLYLEERDDEPNRLPGMNQQVLDTLMKHARISGSSSEITSVESEAEPPKDVQKSISSSSASSSVFDIRDKSTSNIVKESTDKMTRQSVVGQYAILKTVVQPDKTKEEEPQQPKKRKKKTEKVEMVDMELQTSLMSLSESLSPSSNLSVNQINTIKSFIQGLTGGSHEGLAKMRSVPSLKKSSVKVAKRESDRSKIENKEKSSDLEETKEEELSLLDYTEPNGQAEAVDSGATEPDAAVPDNTEPEAAEPEAAEPEVTVPETTEPETAEPENVNESKELHPKNFHRFAKETLSARRRSRQSFPATNSTVMTLIEQRKKSLDRGEGNQRKNLPLYRRLNLDQSQSDPIPIESSVSEGEIKCKCTISSGEVHACKQRIEGRNKPLKKYTEFGRKMELGNSAVTIARKRTQYNNWISYCLRKYRKPCNDSSISSSIDFSK